ncbi:MAG: metallophosphoesterase [Alphaproteobacteria bacterium]|nr:metallophosphoesterase [Alphaproteobacteria bacterium]
MELKLPDFALVALFGSSDALRAAFAAAAFGADRLVCLSPAARDDPQALRRESGELRARLEARRLAVLDAGPLKRVGREAIVALARKYHAPCAAIVLEEAGAPGAYAGLAREGFRVERLRADEADAARITLVPLDCDRRGEHGPFDIIGDVHGCRAELETLLARLGYAPGRNGAWAHPAGRRAILLGDLVDRGPDITGVLRLAMAMVESGAALAVPGNHDLKLARKLLGHNVKINGGLAESLAQLAALPGPERDRLQAALPEFFERLPSHLWLDGGRLVTVHAGLEERMQGRESSAVRAFALYGDPTGETDAYGLPVRRDWAAGYRGTAAVVYGHTVVPRAEWINNTICLDTGCVFGGALSALRYPERELVEVPAARVYYASVRPLERPAGTLRAAE